MIDRGFDRGLPRIGEPILAAKEWTTNGYLIADVARLGYLKKSDRILDPTFGFGTWWSKWRPRELFCSDIDPDKSPSPAADFRNLGAWLVGYFDAVAFDPPYGLRGTVNESNGGYGLDAGYMSIKARHKLICDGMTECARVLKVGGILLLKCQDQVCSGKIQWQTDIFTRHGEALGLVKIDRFDMLGTGRVQPERTRRDGEPSVQQHAYGRPSTLLVFRKAPKKVIRRRQV